jgi:hypothetical protein
MRKIWLENKIPGDWYKGIIVPVHKKGDRKLCNNYSGITLLSQTFKIYERTLGSKLTNEIETKLEEQQYAFRGGRATTDLIFTIRQIIEKNWEYGRNLFFVIIDYEKAFDNIDRSKSWSCLSKLKI